MSNASERGALTRAEFLRRTEVAGAGLVLAETGLLERLADASVEPGNRHFVSRPDLRPPMIDVLHPVRAARTMNGSTTTIAC